MVSFNISRLSHLKTKPFVMGNILPSGGYFIVVKFMYSDKKLKEMY